MRPWRRLLVDRRQTWIDVGAYEGRETLPYAAANPFVTVFAFEPNLDAATRLRDRLPNYVVIPSAVGKRDGTVAFRVNGYAAASSTRSLDLGALAGWRGGDSLQEVATRDVRCTRLDTFMKARGISIVHYLKVDAQGADLEVLESAGDEIAHVLFVRAEAPRQGRGVYKGGHTRAELVEYLRAKGFDVAKENVQSAGQEVDLVFENREQLGNLRVGLLE